MNKQCFKLSMVIIVLTATTMVQAMKPVACTGVSKQCTKDQRTDKTIDGQAFSCYQCKQTVCKSGGSGPIAGTETTTVCESKAATGRALIKNQHSTQFDEADAIFGKRTEVKSADPKPTNSTSTKTQKTKTVDHRTSKANKIDHRYNPSPKKKPERGTKRPTTKLPSAPTNVTLYDATNNQVSISWIDNANNEYGVSVERGIPTKERGGINYHWQHVFNVEERMDDNVKGTGWRTDGDDGLVSNTEYCYRLRAYQQTEFSEYSSPACTTTSR